MYLGILLKYPKQYLSLTQTLTYDIWSYDGKSWIPTTELSLQVLTSYRRWFGHLTGLWECLVIPYEVPEDAVKESLTLHPCDLEPDKQLKIDGVHNICSRTMSHCCPTAYSGLQEDDRSACSALDYSRPALINVTLRLYTSDPVESPLTPTSPLVFMVLILEVTCCS